MYYSRDERRPIDRLATDLFARRHAQLTRVARHHCRREADVEDALQEAFAAFLTEYDPDGGAPALPWLTVVLKRKCWRTNERREVEVEPLAMAEVVVEETLDPSVRFAERDEARARLGELKRDERRALILHAAGYTYGEIAGRYGWTQTKVNRCLYEGRVALREAGSIAG
jgi:RNA polymerase sigma factor (sigma-70 family)